jgi:uncharacterized protein YqeY
MILDDIKKANMQALKDKDQVARGIYSIVMTKAMQQTIVKREKGEELVDADMVAILQKTIKELGDEAENYIKANNQAKAEEIKTQATILEKYLPQMLSAEEIHNIIAGLEDKSIPNVMKYFKANYAGKCDMKLVQEELRKF